MKDGDVIAMVLTNIPEFPIANLGIMKANLIVTSVSPIFTPGSISFLLFIEIKNNCFTTRFLYFADEISRQLVDADVKVIITEVDLAPNVRKAIQKCSRNIRLIVVRTEVRK